MDNQCTVQVKLELGHRAQLRKKPTTEGFTHDWMVFVRGPEQSDIQHFVEKVVFRLHESFPKPKRVCKEPPYKVEESGYAGFIMPIDVYFKNKEEPKKVCFTYDLFLNLEGNPPVNHLRCEKLTFNNPTKEFRRKLVKAGGVMVMPEGTDTTSRPSPDYPMLPTIPLSAFSDPKKSKPSHGSKDTNRESSKSSKPHKVTKEHKERTTKDSENKTTAKEPEKEHSKSSKELSRKSAESKISKEEKSTPKATSKEPKPAFKESKLDSMSPKGSGTLHQESKPSIKRPSNVDLIKSNVKKQKKSTSETSKTFPSVSPRISSTSYSEKKQTKEKEKEKEKVNIKVEKVKTESSVKEVKKPVDSDECNSEDEVISKSESVRTSQSNTTSSSDSSSDSDFAPSQNHRQGPLRSMVEEIQSEGSDDDSSSEEERAVKNIAVSRDNRLSLSDDSGSESSENCNINTLDQPSIQKHLAVSNKASGRKSPENCEKPDKLFKKGLQDKSYTEELVDLHRRLMALRERNVLQQIVNLIEETGHFNVTNTTFDFDLFSLDETTVRKLQTYLAATAT
ncbi:protein ENL isoform X1 [Amblyraja radiata]|uniref:protein ENL isoform X1 n=2 Tax=Amblyraja radiata TaxID=386614 RepID=UPI001403BF0C|nr:protein ENL isoform X1 [Amblyraja radiata]